MSTTIESPSTTAAAGEIGVAAAEAIRGLTARAIGPEPIAAYVARAPLAWSALTDGGWDLIGVAGPSGGAGATLRDLVEVAKAWGEAIVPLPLIPTMMARRWSAAARAVSAPVTVAIRTTGPDGLGVSPFAAEPGVLVLGPGDELQLALDPRLDDFAPSLRLADVALSSTLDVTRRAELAVVWAAEAVGCASRMLTEAVAYAKQRHQFGQPIAQFQAVKHQLADALIHVEQADSATIWASLEPRYAFPAARLVFDSTAKVIETAIQVHGGLGFTWELGLHFYLRHVHALGELVRGLSGAG